MNAPRIMIVEDEHIIALDLKMHLQKNGYEVIGMYSSGEDAVSSMETIRPDLVLMDIKLQGTMDGVQASTIIKADYHVPVILLTAFADEATIERAKITEPFGYIIKPFEERELKTAIAIALYRHKIEQQLRRREALFSTIFNSIADGVIVLNDGARIEYMNPVAEFLSGLRLEDAQGRTIGEAVPALSEIPLGAREVSRGGPVELPLPDGRTGFMDFVVSSLKNTAGSGGAVIVLHDVTGRIEAEKALRESEEQLRHAQKMEAIGRLAGGIAHDFNNLLTVIMGYTRLILDDFGASAEIRSNIEGIQQAALRSVSLTRQLLTFSRHQVMESRDIDLNELVSDMEKLVRRLLVEDTRISINLDAARSEIHVDQGQIEQVLINLVVNARDAMPEGGSLVIKTQNVQVPHALPSVMGPIPAGNYVILSVRDTGIGIKKELITKIFDPFFTTKDSGQGTGLGLSMAYGIVQQSNGYITVQSEENRGSVFTVFFPLIAATAEAEPSLPVHKEADEGSETVLIVEDEEHIRKLITRLLNQRGYRVFESQNAGEALMISEEHHAPIDLLITDVIMPHISGAKLAKRLSTYRPEMKVLFISGYPQKVLVDRGLLDEGAQFIQKPFDMNRFAAKIRQVLDS